MLFDPRAALAEIRKQRSTPATPATPATQTPQNGPYVAKVADVAAPQRPNRIFAEQAVFPENDASPKLLMKPATCAVCGQSGWRVSLADTDGRHFHVECWLRCGPTI